MWSFQASGLLLFYSWGMWDHGRQCSRGFNFHLLRIWYHSVSEIRSRSSRESPRRQNALRPVKTSSAAPTTPILERRTLWGQLGWNWKDWTMDEMDEINVRFVCFLLSSCDDISTNCEDCHAGVPQCQVSITNDLSYDRGASHTISFFLIFQVGLDCISHPQTSHSSNVIAAIPPPLCRCATMETLLTENARQRRWPALLLRQQRRHRLKTLVWTSFLLIWRTTHDERSIINTIIITIWSSRSSSFFVLFHMLLQADVFISRLLLLMSHHLTSQSKPNWWRFCCFSCSWF